MGTGNNVHPGSAGEQIKAAGLGRQRMFRQLFAPGNIHITLQCWENTPLPMLSA